MKNIFVINGGTKFAHSGARFNQTLTEIDRAFFTPANGFALQVTDINEPYNVASEIEKFLWADVVIYHFPIWWMGLPYPLKAYFDHVLTAGHRKGLYHSDGRKAENPAINYGKGGELHGKKYLTTTTWNAPATAFTLPGEFFGQRNVDEGILFGFHKMNEFMAMEALESYHFHDVEKNNSPQQVELHKANYVGHLKKVFRG